MAKNKNNNGLGVYRYIYTRFWLDNYILDLSTDEKLLFIYLLTNNKTNQLGIYEFNFKLCSFETDIPRDIVLEILQKFKNDKKIDYSEENDEIFIINWLKYNVNKSPTVIKNITANIENTRTEEFIKRYIDDNKKYGIDIPYQYSTDRVSTPYQHGTDRVSTPYQHSTDRVCLQEKEKEKEKEKETEKETKKEKENSSIDNKLSTTFSKDSQEYFLSEYLYKKILENDEKYKKPNLQKWAEHIDKLIRLDKRKPMEIKQVIDYATTNDFWKANILSTKKLRDKFTTLQIQLKNSPNIKNKQMKEKQFETINDFINNNDDEMFKGEF